MFSAAAFDRKAHQAGFKPRTWKLQSLMGFVIAAVLLVGAGGLLATVAEHLYLEACGTNAAGTITGRSVRIEHGRIAAPWETMTYEFTTLQGRTIKGELYRPAGELSGLGDGKPITIAYWERYPTINAPRGVRRDIGGPILIGLFQLLMSAGFAGFSRRAIAWAKEYSRMNRRR